MNGRSVVTAVVIALALGMVAGLSAAHEGMPDVIVIDKAQAKKPPVSFPHEQHSQTIECKTCHHIETADVEPESCFNCHGKDPDIPDPSVSGTKQNPFHILCRGCHQEQGKGPVKCAECHKE